MGVWPVHMACASVLFTPLSAQLLPPVKWGWECAEGLDGASHVMCQIHWHEGTLPGLGSCIWGQKDLGLIDCLCYLLAI